MCTIVLLRRPGERWPLILGANRDEMIDRPWDPPAHHWAAPADAFGGRDRLAGGTWLASNGRGLVAAVANRRGSLGPEAGKQSRGALPLLALGHASAGEAAAALAKLDPARYRSFNLVVADAREAFWIARRDGSLTVSPIPEGVSMLTAGELDDPACPRIARFRAAFAAAPPPVPEADDWQAWERLLAARVDDDPRAGMTIPPEDGFGTVSSALIALGAEGGPALWRFAPGRPDRTPFRTLAGAPEGDHLHDC